jgi:hypothetical protein
MEEKLQAATKNGNSEQVKEIFIKIREENLEKHLEILKSYKRAVPDTSFEIVIPECDLRSNNRHIFKNDQINQRQCYDQI